MIPATMLPRAASVPPHSRGGCVLRGCEQRHCWFHSELFPPVPPFLCDFTPFEMGPGRVTQPGLTGEHLKRCSSEMLKNPDQTHKKAPQVDESPSLFPLPVLPAPRQSQFLQETGCVGGDLCPNAICGGPSHTEKVCLDFDRLLRNVAVSMVTIFYSTRGA